jgi:hypothetical protein
MDGVSFSYFYHFASALYLCYIYHHHLEAGSTRRFLTSYILSNMISVAFLAIVSLAGFTCTQALPMPPVYSTSLSPSPRISTKPGTLLGMHYFVHSSNTGDSHRPNAALEEYEPVDGSLRRLDRFMFSWSRRMTLSTIQGRKMNSFSDQQLAVPAPPPPTLIQPPAAQILPPAPHKSLTGIPPQSPSTHHDQPRKDRQDVTGPEKTFHQDHDSEIFSTATAL